MNEEPVTLDYRVERDDLLAWMRWVVNRRPQITKARRFVPPLFTAIVVLITLMQFPSWPALAIAAVAGALIGWLALPRLLKGVVERQLQSSADGVADGVLGDHKLWLRGDQLTHRTTASQSVIQAGSLREIVVEEGRAFLMLGTEQGIVVPGADHPETAAFLAALEAART